MFVGREKEIQLLRKRNRRDQAELVAIYGRRRVGKTALVEKTFQNDVIWKFEGIEGAPEKEELRFFLSQLALYTQDHSFTPKKVTDWTEAFRLLAQKLGQKKIVVFFDEFQWLADMDEHFVSLFKHAWDNYFCRLKNCRFIICGSVSSFIVKKILRSKALYGRVSTEINLQPLSIKETRLLLKNRPSDELVQIYMTFGGVPKYLLELNPGWTYQQNLNEQAFSQNGFFFQEFPRLLISHFASTSHYENILRSLATEAKSLDQLAVDCSVAKGGTFSALLDDLVLAGFIEREYPLDKNPKSKLLRYKLKDEYLHFYFRFILPHLNAIQKGSFSYFFIDQRSLAQWHGYAFERLCVKQAPLIAEALKFSGIEYQYGPWFRPQKPKVQIDLLFKRKDNVLTLCEMKYADLIPSRLVRDVETKCRVLREIFPSFSQQKVLVLGKKTKMAPSIRNYFDVVLNINSFF